MLVKATAKYVRVSPRKMNIMAGLIRGKSVDVARGQLQFRIERASRLLLAVVDSAAANAYENHSLDEKGLKISQVIVGQGPRLKRFTPKAFGRATTVQKPTSHITVLVEGTQTKAKVQRVAPTATPASDPSTASATKTKRAGSPAAEAAPKKKGFLKTMFQRKSGM